MLRSSFLIFIFCQFLSFSVLAATPQQSFLEQFQTSRLSFPREGDPLNNVSGRYPAYLNFLFQNVLSWVPEGAPRPMTAACEPDVWGERMQDQRVKGSIALQAGLVQKYFQECSTDLATGNSGSIVNLTRMMSMKFQPQEHPFMHKVVLNLPGNVKLKGLLGLKGDFKSRPLVVLRLGIFSSVDDFKPERAWAMMLFEQSPFNVLLLENMSSADFVANNSQFAFGGYDEGLQNILVAKLLQDPMQPLSRLVDSVHFFGVSLGGHGTLFASLLNEYNSSPGRPLINSFTAMCPVVDLQTTMSSLTEGGLFSKMVDLWSRERLKDLGKKVAGVNEFESFAFLSKVVSEISRTYQGGLSYVSSIHLPPGMKDGADFWGLNNFWPFYNNVKAPVLIMTTDEDLAVPYTLNSERLMNHSIKFNSKNIRVVPMSMGYHCTLPIPYDWKALSTILQSYVLSHSPTFKMIPRSLELDLADEDWKEFYQTPAQVKFVVKEPGKNNNFVKLELIVTNKAGEEKSLNVSMPLSDFDFRFLNPKLTDPETEMLLRWLNQNLKAELPAGPTPKIKISWKVAA